MHLNSRRSMGRGRGRVCALAAVGLTLVVAVAGCSSGQSSSRTAEEFEFSEATPAGSVLPPSRRAEAPSFRGELLDGTVFDSSALAGDIAVINFWGSWCPPCRVETPDLQAIYADVRDQGVQFLGVDVKDERQLARAFIAEVGAQYPSLSDPRGEVALQFRGFPANAIPSTILLDRKGRVAAVYTGAVTQDHIRPALTALLEETGP